MEDSGGGQERKNSEDGSETTGKGGKASVSILDYLRAPTFSPAEAESTTSRFSVFALG